MLVYCYKRKYIFIPKKTFNLWNFNFVIIYNTSFIITEEKDCIKSIVPS